MKPIAQTLKQERFLWYGVVLGLIFSGLLSFLYFGQINSKLSEEFDGIKVVLSTKNLPNTTLLYTHGQRFSAKNIVQNTSGQLDTLEFLLPKSDSVVTRFRLDFGKTKYQDAFTINAMVLIFGQEEIVLSKEEVFQKLENKSAAISIDKGLNEIQFNTAISPFDPYVIFSPMVESTVGKKHLAMYLLLPFIVLALLYFIFYGKSLKLDIRLLLPMAFILCIPLKIAWTTFFGLLLAVYGLCFVLLKKERFAKGQLFYFFLGFFILLIALGRPSGWSDFDIQLGLLVWSLAGLSPQFSNEKLFTFYVWFFLFLHAIVIASGIGFLFRFSQLYGLEMVDFLDNMKDYSRSMRNWLYYDHAAFLSFFGTIGVLFLHKLHQVGKLGIRTVITYHVLLLAFIFFTATRVGFVIYALVLINVMFTLEYKKKLALNGIFVIAFASFLFLKIGAIDKERAVLWDASWEAIKERTFFGHGLGRSDEILHRYFEKMDNIGFTLLELNHSHNQFLTYSLELGTMGTLVLFIGLVAFMVWSKHYRNEWLLVYVFAAGLLFLTESPLQTSKALYVLCFLFLIIAKRPKIFSDQMLVPKT